MKTKKKIYDIVGFSILAVTVLAYVAMIAIPHFGSAWVMSGYDGLIVFLPLMIAEAEIYIGARYFWFAETRECSKASNAHKNIICSLVIFGSMLVGILDIVTGLKITSNLWLVVISCMLILLAIRHLGSAIRMQINQSVRNTTKVMALIGAVLLLVVAVWYVQIIMFFIV